MSFQCEKALVIDWWVGLSFSSRLPSVSSEKTTPQPQVWWAGFFSSTVMSYAGLRCLSRMLV